MRTYLVVVEDGAAARGAVRFAARRAARTGSRVELVTVIPTPEFLPFGGVQAAMEEEARLRADGLVRAAAGTLFEELGVQPSITVLSGEPAEAVRAHLLAHPEVANLVLGAASGGASPLVAEFAGAAAGSLPCPLTLVPGELSDEAIDKLS